jgi:hypothetical protein
VSGRGWKTISLVSFNASKSDLLKASECDLHEDEQKTECSKTILPLALIIFRCKTQQGDNLSKNNDNNR